MISHLLIGHHGVGLQRSWVSAEQTSSWPIMFTEDSPIDVVKAVTWDQAIPAGRTGETLEKRLFGELWWHITQLLSRWPH